MNDQCPLQPDINRLITAIETQTNQFGNVFQFYQWIIKSLLVVVCVIALGRSALDYGKEIVQKNVIAEERQ